MKDRFDYSDLLDMLQVAKTDNDSMAYRVELVKEICELPKVRISWKKVAEHHTSGGQNMLVYYAEHPEVFPNDQFWFHRMVVTDTDSGVIKPMKTI